MKQEAVSENCREKPGCWALTCLGSAPGAASFDANDLGVLALGACLGVWLYVRASTFLRGQRQSLRVRRGLEGEARAERILERSGYSVLGRQVRRRWPVVVDGEVVELTVIADYVVRGGGASWVAEVKTGPRALSLRHGPTRRQMLEYAHAFSVRGVVLVDPEGETLRAVEFPLATRTRASWLGAWVVSVLMASAACGWAWWWLRGAS